MTKSYRAHAGAVPESKIAGRIAVGTAAAIVAATVAAIIAQNAAAQGVSVSTTAGASTSCQNLPALQIANARITAAVPVPGGSFTAPDGVAYSVPPFCNVSLVLTPSSDSLINMLLWLPLSGWNGRFEATGNGGYGGNNAGEAPAMISGLQAGFAVAGNDMGTVPSTNTDADALVGHPQKWIDWGYRSTHLMPVVAKQIVQTFYGQAPRYSYFNSCSTGGQEALMEAQRYPADYDGILGGDPANNRTHVHTVAV
jgi:feruloyl esterase